MTRAGGRIREAPMPQATRITVSGAPEGFDARLLLEEAERAGGCVLHVARDDKRLAAMEAALAFFAPDVPVLRFPGWDCLPYDRVSPNADIAAARMATLAAFAQTQLSGAGGVLFWGAGGRPRPWRWWSLRRSRR